MKTVRLVDTAYQAIFISDHIKLFTFNINCSESRAIQHISKINNKGIHITENDYRSALDLLDWDSLLFWYSNDNLYIGSSLGGSLTYLYHDNNQILISKSEKLLIEKQGYDSNIVKSALLESNRKIPCLHGFQKLDDQTTEQILLPGMFHVLGENSKSRQQWFVNISSFCENNDDDFTVSKFTELLTTSINDLSESLNGINVLQLSSGIDSAIIAAALKATGKEDDFLCVNFQPGDFLHESVPANILAKDLNLNFLTLPEYSVASSLKKGDEFLKYFWSQFDDLRSISHMTQCFYNMSLSATPYFGYHNLLGGHVLGVNLQIYPFINYDRFTTERKHLYDKNRINEKIQRRGFTCQNKYQIYFENTTFNNYLYESLGPYSYIAYIFLDERTLIPLDNSTFYIKKNELIEASIEFVLEKVKYSDFYKTQILSKPYSPLTAEKLLKLFTFITQQTKQQTGFRAYSLADVANPIEPLQTSSITLLLLQQKINDTLINYPKWHEFELFANLTGFRFEDHYKSAYTKKLKYNKLATIINSDIGNSHPFLRYSFYKSFVRYNHDQFKYLIDKGLLERSKLQDLVDSKCSLHKARTLERQANIGSICMGQKHRIFSN